MTEIEAWRDKDVVRVVLSGDDVGAKTTWFTLERPAALALARQLTRAASEVK